MNQMLIVLTVAVAAFVFVLLRMIWLSHRHAVEHHQRVRLLSGVLNSWAAPVTAEECERRKAARQDGELGQLGDADDLAARRLDRCQRRRGDL